MSRDLFQDATALEELLSQQDDSSDWREWSLLAGDGDAAALIELVSENKVHLFDIYHCSLWFLKLALAD